MKPEHYTFLAGCRMSIESMRRAGMNDAIISCVLSEVRAAAVFAERFRLESLFKQNPPEYVPFGEYADAIKEVQS